MRNNTETDNLENDLIQAQQVLSELDVKLSSISIDPHNPGSVESAIQSSHQLIDIHLRRYSSNPALAFLIEHLKAEQRENIIGIARAASARSCPAGR